MPSLRVILPLTVLLLAAHVTVLTTLGTGGHGPTLSNLIQLALGAVCVLAAVLAAWDSSGFERRFLLLTGSRYVIWCVAQGLTFVDAGSDVPFESSLSNLLFHLEDLPLAVALFLLPDAGSHSDRLGRPGVRDVVQIALFLGAVVLYGAFNPVGPGSGVGRLASTDALIATGFFLRAMATESPMAAALFGRWTPAILLSATNDAFSGHLSVIPETGDLFDLLWSTEIIVWIMTAATWKAMNADFKSIQQPIDVTVRRLPVIVALFASAMAVGLAARQPLLAGGLVAASVVCAWPRLRGAR